MVPPHAHGPLAILLAAAAVPACGGGDLPAAAYLISDRQQWVGGSASTAREGDYILENGEIRLGILGQPCEDGLDAGEFCAAPGPGLYRGSLVDIDRRRLDGEHSSGHGRDQFTEIFDSVSMDLMATRSVAVISDGSDGGPAIIRSQGPAGNYISYIGLIGGLLNLPPTWHITDYILRPGDPYLTIRTTAVVVPEPDAGMEVVQPVDPCAWASGDEGLPCDALLLPSATEPLPLIGALQAGEMAFGDFFFAGADVDFFAAGMGFDEDMFVFDAMQTGRNTIIDPFPFSYLGATGDRVSYAAGSTGTISAPIFTSGLTAVFGATAPAPRLDDEGDPQWLPGDAATWERFIGVGVGDVGSAVEQVWQARIDHGMETPLGRVQGHVLEEETLTPLSATHVLVYLDSGAARDGDGVPPLADLFLEWQSDVGEDRTPDGSFGGLLPPGNYLLVTKKEGRAPGAATPVLVTTGGTTELTVLARRSAHLDVFVTDEHGDAMPAKVSILPADEATRPIRSDLGDPYVAGGFSAVENLMPGGFGIDLVPGRYHVLVSRGVERSIWDSRTDGAQPGGITLQSGRSVRLDAILYREVDSTGWISADFHVHGANSHDSGMSAAGRALSMATHGVEFFSGTDHDVFTDYRPVIDQMGLNRWVQSTVGVETTTIELGHWLGFPLAVDYDATNQGALDWTDLWPQEIIDGLRAHAEGEPADTFIWNAHPRDGILGYFDQYSLDPFVGTTYAPVIENDGLLSLGNPILRDPDTFTLDYDGIEVLNAKRYDLIRTPTEEEIHCFKTPRPKGCQDGPPLTMYRMNERTMAEQEALTDLSLPFTLTRQMQGQVDDWFTLLNLGYRHTAIGNSDTHGLHSPEPGCPQNFVRSTVDDPELIDARDVARALREHRVVASYGPLLDMWVGDAEHGIGSDVVLSSGVVPVHVEVQAPLWMGVDRVELYENARLVHVWEGEEIDPNSVLRLSQTWEAHPVGTDGLPRDAWYVAIAMGDSDMSPVFTPIDIPPIQLNDVVIGAVAEIDLGAIDLASAVGEPVVYPKTGAVYPYALTNPIWVDVDGDRDGIGGPFEPLGRVPEWFRGTPVE